MTPRETTVFPECRTRPLPLTATMLPLIQIDRGATFLRSPVSGLVSQAGSSVAFAPAHGERLAEPAARAEQEPNQVR